MKNISLFILLSGILSLALKSQGVFKSDSAHITQTLNSHLILQNCSWVSDNSTLQADAAWVTFTGTNTDSIGGTPTTFGRLHINKNGGQVHLKQYIAVEDSLALTSGLLALGEYDLRLLPGAQTSTGHTAAYIQTAGTGRMWAEVGSSPQLFPIGNSSYRPAILLNTGNPDFFGLRTSNEVLKGGASGNPMQKEAVAASWYVKEKTPGGSRLQLRLQWNETDELNGFDRNCAYIARYRNNWDRKPPAIVQGNDPFTINRSNLKRDSLFAILTYRPRRLAAQNCPNCSQIRFDFCEGEAAPDLEALLHSNARYETGSSFLWFEDNHGSMGNPINTPIPDMSRNNTKFYWVSQDKYGCESIARRVRIRVRKTSTVVFDVPHLGCEGAYLDLSDWVSDSRGIATGFSFWDGPPGQGANLLGSVSAQGGVVNYGQYVSAQLPAQPVTYYATATNHTGCQVTGSDQVSSQPNPSLEPIRTVIATAGDTVRVPFITTNASYVFWQTYGPNRGTSIGLLGNFGTGDMMFIASNPTSQAKLVHASAIAYGGNCASPARTFQIVIHPHTNNRQAASQLQFTASKINPHDVQLDWQIDFPFEINQIEIEKQMNDGEWKTVGSGHALTLPDGTYIDRSGMGNLTKYRLKLMLGDGRSIWSDEAKVNFDFFDSQRFTLYPNPSAGRFSLRAAGELRGEWRFKLTDPVGRTILMGKLTGRETAFDISHLPAAHYFLLLTSPEGRRYLEQVVKQ